MIRNDFEFKAEILRRKESYLKQRQKKRRIYLSAAGSLAVACVVFFIILSPGISERNGTTVQEGNDLSTAPNYVSVNGKIWEDLSKAEAIVPELESLFIRDEDSSSRTESFSSSGESDSASADTKQEGETYPTVDSPSSVPESTGDSPLDWIEDPGTDAENDIPVGDPGAVPDGEDSVDSVPHDSAADSSEKNYIVIEVYSDGERSVYTLFSDRICSEGKTVFLTSAQSEKLWNLFEEK